MLRQTPPASLPPGGQLSFMEIQPREGSFEFGAISRKCWHEARIVVRECYGESISGQDWHSIMPYRHRGALRLRSEACYLHMLSVWKT